MSQRSAADRTPGKKFVLACAAALSLMVPLLAVFLLVYDRQDQSRTATGSIAQGWGGAQAISGPVIVIPYWETTDQDVVTNGSKERRSVTVWRDLTIAPDTASMVTRLEPERKRRSIYDLIVFQARTQGRASFVLPVDLARLGVRADRLALDRAEVRFGVGDPRGLSGPRPTVRVGGTPVVLSPGKGSANSDGSGFHGIIDARRLVGGRIDVTFDHVVRGSGSLALRPNAGDTRWQVTSSWQHPSFQGDFLPAAHRENAGGFAATWRIGNLALGGSLVSAGTASDDPDTRAVAQGDAGNARIDLVTPANLYDRVNRATKYGFLFIGFTFTALLLFDVVGGARVSSVEYLLVGAGLVLFFVMLLAFAEVIGFAPAYALAAGAIIALLSAYSASILRSRRRGGMIAGLLTALYATLYVLISLEAYSLLIGSILLFMSLAAVMFMTRHVDWSGRGEGEAE